MPSNFNANRIIVKPFLVPVNYPVSIIFKNVLVRPVAFRNPMLRSFR